MHFSHFQIAWKLQTKRVSNLWYNPVAASKIRRALTTVTPMVWQWLPQEFATSNIDSLKKKIAGVRNSQSHFLFVTSREGALSGHGFARFWIENPRHKLFVEVQ